MGRARQARDDIVAGDLIGRHVEFGREGRAGQGDGLEVAAARLDLQRIEIQSCAAEQVHRHIALNPALHRHPLGRRIGTQDVELRHAPGVGDRRPAVRGRRRLVHDQHARRPVLGGLLVLVGPAAVIGHGLAAEGVQRRLLEIGVIDQDDQDLAAQVLVLEVVPVPLGRIDAVADEDQGRVLQADMLGRTAGGNGHLAALGHRQAPVPQLQRGMDVGLDETVQDDVLGPLAVGTARLETGGRILSAQVLDDLLFSRGGDAASLIGVARQDADILRNPRGVEGRRGLIRSDGGAGGQGDAGHQHGGERRDDTHEHEAPQPEMKSPTLGGEIHHVDSVSRAICRKQKPAEADFGGLMIRSFEPAPSGRRPSRRGDSWRR